VRTPQHLTGVVLPSRKAQKTARPEFKSAGDCCVSVSIIPRPARFIGRPKPTRMQSAAAAIILHRSMVSARAVTWRSRSRISRWPASDTQAKHE
jgi:hypothetical protein